MTDAHLERDDTTADACLSASGVVAVFPSHEQAAVTEHAAELKIDLADYVRQSAVKRAQE
ncbi:hypothetical protein ACFT7S_35655 [Streptomyces sp. NPDC057136]|uniref:hypothetical protein n=1 Tax=Streptomyces sp. NPDC057136 TaxID=3346029 RepID=UPI0036410FC7